MSGFSTNLKALRLANKLSQKSLGELTGLSERGIQNYELNARQPNTEALIAIADYFKVPIDYLLGNGLYAYAEFIEDHFDYFLTAISNLNIVGEPDIIPQFVKKLKMNDIWDKILLLSVFVKDLKIDGTNLKIIWKF